MNRPFWAGAAANAVIIEADAFKESDVIYKALSSRGHHDMIQTAELVETLLIFYSCLCNKYELVHVRVAFIYNSNYFSMLTILNQN